MEMAQLIREGNVFIVINFFHSGQVIKCLFLMFGRLQLVKSGCVTCVQENLRDSLHLGRTGLPDYRNYL